MLKNRESLQRMNVILETPMIRRIKLLAIDNHTSASNLVRQAVHQYLRQPSKKSEKGEHRDA